MGYYVRIGGRAFGPFSEQDVLTLIAQNRVNRTDSVSADGKTWRAAGGFPELFPVKGEGKPPVQGQTPPTRENAPEEWYVSRDGRQTLGPYPAPSVIGMLLNRQLTRNSYVWKKGERPRPFDQESLFYLFLPPEEPAAEDAPPEKPNPVRRISKRRAAEVRDFEKRVSGNYVVSLCSFGATLVLAFLDTAMHVLNAGYESDGLGLAAKLFGGISVLSWLFCVAVSFVLMYRFWSAVQPYGAAATPGKAVGFCFIPFFNLYWIFVCYFVLARDINRHLPEEWHGVRASEFDAFSFCVMSVIPLSFCGLLADQALFRPFSVVVPFLFFVAFMIQPVVITSLKNAVFALIETQ